MRVLRDEGVLRLPNWTAVGVWAFLAASAAATDAPVHPGFPVTAPNQGVVSVGKVLVVDLDANGGEREIVVGTQAGRLFVFNANGAVRAGWGNGAGVLLPSEIASTPAAGNLDSDPELEIVAACGHANPGEEPGQVAAFNHDGTEVWRFNGTQDEGQPNGLPDAVFSSPALGDLDGDGKDDVVFGAFDFRIYALKGTNGTVLPGWPVYIRESTWSSPALADLDGDGFLEVIIGSDTQAETSPYDTPLGGALWVFRRNGSQFPGFPRFVTYAPGETAVGIQASPVVGDITGDNCPEIIVGTGQPFPFSNPAGRLLHAWSWDGSIPPGWPKVLDGFNVGSLALANLDADPALEVVAPVINFEDSEGWVYAINGDGSNVFPPVRPRASNGALADTMGEPIIAQVGSDNPAILVSSVGFDVAIISKTGAMISDDFVPPPGGLTYTTGHPVPGPAVADLSDNGTLTVIAASGASATDPDDLRVFAWDAGPVGALPWPMFRQNPQHTATAPGTIGCPLPSAALSFQPVAPCRIADSRAPGNLTFGGPKLVAGEQRTITFHGSCGIPATAKAVSLNITVTDATLAGAVRLFPGHDGTPTAVTIQYRAGQTRANNVVVGLSFDGRGHLTEQVDMAPGGQVHVILDVNGYFL